MRFQKDMKDVTPILSAHPPKNTMSRGDGHHSGNPHVRKAVENGKIQHVAWAYERPNGCRGFGFAGGHFHRNWGDTTTSARWLSTPSCGARRPKFPKEECLPTR